MSEYHNYSFIVDGGLNCCARAPSEEIARARIAATWPRSKIALKGVDLPSAERTIQKPAGELRPVHISKSQSSTPAPSAPKHGDYADAINIALAGG